jgi:hypothetical protein
LAAANRKIEKSKKYFSFSAPHPNAESPPHGFPFGIVLAAISSSQPNAKEVKRVEAATPLIVPRLSFRPVRQQRICIGKADDPHQLKQERTNAPKRTLETATRA